MLHANEETGNRVHRVCCGLGPIDRRNFSRRGGETGRDAVIITKGFLHGSLCGFLSSPQASYQQKWWVVATTNFKSCDPMAEW
jgi:hypothetical protein